MDAVVAGLARDEFQYDAPLSKLSRWRIGGAADLVVTPASRDALARTLRAAARSGLPHVVIGDGSNLLFDDAGFRGVVVQIGRALGGVSFGSDGEVTVGAGHWVPHFVHATINQGLAGAIHAIGIPGTVGGLVAMNGGSQRKGIGEHLIAAEVIDFDGNVRWLQQEELDFSYRHSRLQDGALVLVSARFRFEPGDARALRREAVEIMRSRRAKFPKVRANCGSVFVSDPRLYSLIGPPGLAIERAGLKGLAAGDAQISPEHANFIVNNGQARSVDVLALIAAARRRVFELTGVAMLAEVRHLSPVGQLRPAHELADQFGPLPLENGND
ncbi:UDP-N-acetylmuramate dehydrogenase [Caulobacter hibisci]|uniref:UDP-N-acetylenolpyruvoylglucosamine reductase n=1 Tax=Caulobacter hibisci TaxID=2035993 RepID=A0ABS0T836_9CAUL|nr:UDP-N-acetylmuramate dehydrogenase [Caulobacter hibisci]